jgi:hypothetical protein
MATVAKVIVEILQAAGMPGDTLNYATRNRAASLPAPRRC